MSMLRSVTSNSIDDLSGRLERVESELAIRRLAARYALAVDSRDLDTLVQLFVPDVDCGRHGSGREALRAFYSPLLATFYRSVHLLGGHSIEFDGSGSADGHVYCRAEHEMNGRWVAEALCYHDRYVRHEDGWLFESRRPHAWYAADWLSRPGGPDFDERIGKRYEATLPAAFPTWSEFWRDVEPLAVSRLTDTPVH